MNHRHVRTLVLATLLGSAPVALAHGSSADADDAAARQPAPASAQAPGQVPAGAAALPPASPPATSQPSRIGNITDVPGSMSDGGKDARTGEVPAGAKSLPPVLPRSTPPNGRIGNMEDVTGSMSDGSAPKK